MAALICAALLLCLAGREGAAGEARRSLEHDGRERTYRLYTPERSTWPEALPLVIVLHGGGGNGARVAKVSGAAALADREGFALVFPDAYKRHWNDGRQSFSSPSYKARIDDVGFVGALIDAVQAAIPIDERRIYVAGASNGGMMAQRLACELGDRLAAVASVIASLPEPLVETCAPARPIPVLFMNGTADRLVPWDGGSIGLGLRSRGRVISTLEAVEFWRRANGCSNRQYLTEMPDRDPNDGVTVERRTWADCRAGGEVVLYRLENGGHRWPGRIRGGSALIQRVMGKVGFDIDGGEEVWAFFRRHRLP